AKVVEGRPARDWGRRHNMGGHLIPMSFQPLAEKYRPRRINDFIGLGTPKSILLELAAKPYPSCWLFVGPCATGKTSMGLALADAIPAQLHHIGAKSCTVEAIEEVSRKCHFVPALPGDPQIMLFH